MRGSTIALGGAIALGFLLCGPSTGAQPNDKVEVEADSLEIDHRTRTASFEGSVSASYRDLTLTCDRMSVTYDESGDVSTLKATGKVRVTRGDARATARTARLDARLGILVLEGSPVLFRQGSKLEGARITVSLATGKVEVARARGVFNLKAGSSDD